MNEHPMPAPLPVATSASLRETIIRPRRGWVRLDWAELWAYRDLLYYLTWRDIKVRYKQTVFGVGWALIQPLVTMAVFSIVFGRYAEMPSDGLPYPLFSYAGLLPWGLFAFALTQSSNSLVASQQLVTHVYFPRIFLPFASVTVGVVDFLFASTALVVMLAYYEVMPTARIFILPVAVLVGLVAAVGVGFWLSALNVKYRDVRYALPFLTQVWLFATPIVYPATLVPSAWRPFLGLNPMAGPIEAFRWALGGESDAWPLLGISAAVAFALFVFGVAYFRSVERSFADVI